MDNLLSDEKFVDRHYVPYNESKKKSSSPSFLTAFFLIVGLLLGFMYFTTHEQLKQANERITELENSSKTTSETYSETVEDLEAKVKLQEDLLASREGFLTAVGQAVTVLESAQGKADTEPLRNVILKAQDTVSAERSHVYVIDSATATVKAYSDATALAVEAYDNRSSSNSSPENNPQVNTNVDLTSARAALDEVGGSWVTLDARDLVCDMTDAIACATPGHVSVASHVAENSKEWWIGPMTHEYAHQIQYQNWDKVMNSVRAVELFGEGDRRIENMADCMTVSKLPNYIGPYQPNCSAEQVAYGTEAWNGNF